MYQERIETQTETNKAISGLILDARNDPKKYLPYGPILMNVYNKQLIDANTSALISTIEESKRDYCLKKCNGKETCVSPCEKFFTWSVTYALDHFQRVHKYAYAPSINEEEEWYDLQMII